MSRKDDHKPAQDRSHPLGQLHRFAAGEASSEDRRQVLVHLLEGCAPCASELRDELLPEVDPRALEGALDRVLGGSRQLVHRVERQREQARELLARIETASAERQAEEIEVLDPLMRQTFFEAVIDECQRARHESVRRTLALAELAVRVAETIPGVPGEEGLARARGELGNAYRILGDLPRARQTLRQAREQVAGRSPTVEAQLLSFQASLAHDLRRYDRGIQLLERAVALFERHGQARSAQRARIQLGYLAGQGDPEKGARILRQVLAQLDGEDREADRLQLLAVHNLIQITYMSGQAEEAARLISETRPLMESSEPHLDFLRFEWLTAQVDHELGRHRESAARLERLRESYLAEDLPYEVALVSLDLAVVYARLDRRDRVRSLAEETVRIFQALEIGRESVAALGLLARAEAEEIAEIAGRLASAVERTRSQRMGAGSV